MIKSRWAKSELGFSYIGSLWSSKNSFAIYGIQKAHAKYYRYQIMKWEKQNNFEIPLVSNAKNPVWIHDVFLLGLLYFTTRGGMVELRD